MKLSECKGHHGGTLALNEYGPVLNVLAVADARVSCACLSHFLLASSNCFVVRLVCWCCRPSLSGLSVLAVLSCGRNIRVKVLSHFVGVSGKCSDPCVGRHFVQVQV